jgi:hypothetical protein
MAVMESGVEKADKVAIACQLASCYLIVEYLYLRHRHTELSRVITQLTRVS